MKFWLKGTYYEITPEDLTIWLKCVLNVPTDFDAQIAWETLGGVRRYRKSIKSSVLHSLVMHIIHHMIKYTLNVLDETNG